MNKITQRIKKHVVLKKINKKNSEKNRIHSKLNR